MGRQRGQGLVEYALLIALIAVAAAASVRAVGPAAREAFQRAVLVIGDGDITLETPAPTLTAEASQTPAGTTTPQASVTPGATATSVSTPTPVPTPGETPITDGCSTPLRLTRPGLYKAACRLNYAFDQLRSGSIAISPALPAGMSLIANLPAGSYTFHGALSNGQPPTTGPFPLTQGDLDALAGGYIIFTVSYLPVDGGFLHQAWQGVIEIKVRGIVGVPIPGPHPIIPKPPIVLD
ncbi:MAG: hypothetical protein ACUVT1_01095 [Anaerolineae bacterium]